MCVKTRWLSSAKGSISTDCSDLIDFAIQHDLLLVLIAAVVDFFLSYIVVNQMAGEDAGVSLRGADLFYVSVSSTLTVLSLASRMGLLRLTEYLLRDC